MAKIISSQRARIWEIVDEKVAALEASGAAKVQIPVVTIGEIDGETYRIMIDGHHTLEAAQELGLEIEFVEAGREYTADYDPDWTPEDYLENLYMDSQWYDVLTGYPVF